MNILTSSPTDAIAVIAEIEKNQNTLAAISTVIPALSHHHPSVRSAAVEVLVKLAPATVDPLISAYITSSDQGLQAYITQALAQIGNPKAIDLLVFVMGTEVANHCQGNVRRIAARGLGRIGSTNSTPEIVPHVVEKLTWALLTPEDWGLRYAAAVSLQEIGTPSAYSALEVALNLESDPVVRSRIAVALE